MNIRCIHCGRPANKVTLSTSFQCIDATACKDYTSAKKAPAITVSIYFDGACLGANKAGGQPIGIGVAVFIDNKYIEEWSGHKAIEWGSNNDAEWIALLYAMSVAVLMRKSNAKYVFRVYGDSQIIINSFNGLYRVSSKFASYADKAYQLKIKLGLSLHFVKWIPRASNMKADELSKIALLSHTPIK